MIEINLCYSSLLSWSLFPFSMLWNNLSKIRIVFWMFRTLRNGMGLLLSFWEDFKNKNPLLLFFSFTDFNSIVLRNLLISCFHICWHEVVHKDLFKKIFNLCGIYSCLHFLLLRFFSLLKIFFLDRGLEFISHLKNQCLTLWILSTVLLFH